MATSEAQAKLQEGQGSYFAEPQDLSRAVLLFRETTDIAPTWEEGFLWLGAALLDEFRFSEAEENYLRAISLDATDSRPHLHLGGAYERQGRLEDAVRCYRQGLALKPYYGNADAHMMLAGVLKRLGRLDEAVREWQAVAQMEPMYPSYESPIEEAKRELKNYGLIA